MICQGEVMQTERNMIKECWFCGSTTMGFKDQDGVWCAKCGGHLADKNGWRLCDCGHPVRDHGCAYPGCAFIDCKCTKEKPWDFSEN